MTRIAHQFRQPKTALKHPKFTQAVIAHEYGHAFFYENMRQRFPDIFSPVSKFETKYVSVTAAIKKMRASEENIKSQLVLANAASDEVKAERLSKELRIIQHGSLLEASMESEAVLIPLQRLRRTLEPYSELFADAVAVRVFNDPSVMRRFYQSANGHGVRRSMVPATDFSRNHRAEHWNLTEPHVLLSPTRTHLWRQYFSNPAYARYPDLMSRLLAAIGKEVRSHVNVTEQLSPRKMNEQLIKAIDEEMARP